jgi:hypothetical protein
MWIAAPAMALMAGLSLLSDWIRRQDVDYVEGGLVERKHWIQWGTCYPYHPAYPEGRRDLPRYTFRYITVWLPSWSMEIGYNGRLEWHQRALHKFGPGPFQLQSWPDTGWSDARTED